MFNIAFCIVICWLLIQLGLFFELIREPKLIYSLKPLCKMDWKNRSITVRRHILLIFSLINAPISVSSGVTMFILYLNSYRHDRVTAIPDYVTLKTNETVLVDDGEGCKTYSVEGYKLLIARQVFKQIHGISLTFVKKKVNEN